MEALEPAVKPFAFSTSLILQEATGLRAATLPQLLRFLRDLPDSCLYYHTHYFLLQHHYLTPEPTNDFAYWVSEVLGEEALGERLASIDVIQYTSLAQLRQAIVGTIEEYLKRTPLAQFRFASEGEELFFVKSIHVIMPTAWTASTIEEFARALEQISIHALYFHIFDARLRLGRHTNDFALWFEQQGYPELAKEIAALDPYAHTLEALRSMLLSMIRKQVLGTNGVHGQAVEA